MADMDRHGLSWTAIVDSRGRNHPWTVASRGLDRMDRMDSRGLPEIGQSTHFLP